MFQLTRIHQNPILSPNLQNNWEAEATFNGCIAKNGNNFYLIYRALSSPQNYYKQNLKVSSIGIAESKDGINFGTRKQLIKPEQNFEIFGCEDPRITKIDGKYYIFYTALSSHPFTASSIKIAVAISKDLKTVIAKHPVTTFNSKAMALFSERVSGKFAAILTAHTDMPPAKIALATFDNEEQIWSPGYWQKWYSQLDEHVIPLLRSSLDQVEVGAPPLKTKYGWLVVYSYIKNYFSSPRVFGIEAVLLDLKDPLKVIAKTNGPIFIPQTEYEKIGQVSNIVFPSGGLIRAGQLYVYYGAADTTCCLATGKLSDLLKEMRQKIKKPLIQSDSFCRLERFKSNPIFVPRAEIGWEAKATFNGAAVYLGGRVHLVYRAMSQDNTSVLGYGSSSDGITFDERLTHPIYTPREDFEKKIKIGNSGCEDPRITQINDKLYMLYTAFDGGVNPPAVALTHIKVSDFLNKQWNWAKPVIISPKGIDDKDACILPKKIGNKYIIFHRMGSSICIDFTNDLEFNGNKRLKLECTLIGPRSALWDNCKIGIAGPPIETKDGWLLIYHGISSPGNIYKLGAMLLDLNNPLKLIARTNYPLLEPEFNYEMDGLVPNVIFSCGSVVINDKLYIYYGGADKVICGAAVKLKDLLSALRNSKV